MPAQHLINFTGIDIHASGNNTLRRPTREKQIAVLIDPSNIAEREVPPFVLFRRFLGGFELL